MLIVKMVIYALLSSMGLLFLKIGAGKDFGVDLSGNSISVQINYVLILGIFFYTMSFLFSLMILKEANLSVYYSVCSGLAYICVMFLSYFILKEYMTRLQLLGMFLILAGIILINIKK